MLELAVVEEYKKGEQLKEGESRRKKESRSLGRRVRLRRMLERE